MAPKYSILPSGSSPSLDDPSPPLSPLAGTEPGYISPYDGGGDSSVRYASFITDIEEEAPRRPRYRRVDALPAYDSDPRFKVETPSPLTRAALLALVVFLFWWAFNLRKGIWMATGMGMRKQEMEVVDPSY